MGVFHKFEVICANCDARFSAYLVNAVNVTRFPALRQKLLDRSLNRARCPQCGYISIIEKPFFYSDLKRRQFIAIYPRKERHFHKRASEQTNSVFQAFARLKFADPRKSRVVFGQEELREKVVAADHQLDDRTLELLKLYVLRQHPFLLDHKRLRVILNALDSEKAEFYCTFDLERDYFKAYVPRAFLDTLGVSPSASPGATGPQSPAAPAQRLARRTFGGDAAAPWVNLWSINPSTDALSALSNYAQAIRAGHPVDPDDADFKKMMLTLPAGNQLPNWAKADLQVIEEFAESIDRSDIATRIFHIRFGFDIEDEWFKNADTDDVRTIWTLLKDLPDIAVEGNTWIKAIYLDVDDGGGFYSPSTKEIHIGSNIQSGTNAFRNVVLHEVGHSMQEKYDEKSSLVTNWLQTDFGWQVFDATPAGIDGWIALMGGYPAGTTPQVMTQVQSYLRQSMGAGSTFSAAQIVNGPSGHLWNNLAFGPRAAFEKTGSDWYDRYDQWYLAGGLRFFVNYWYVQLIAVSDATLELVASMPSSYASMSPPEFFAELFAWYYDNQAPNRQAIPAPVASWFLTNVGPLDPNSPFAPVRPPPRARAPAKAQRGKPARRR